MSRPDTVSEPTFLRQGSCLMVFTSTEAAARAYEACVAAFHGNQEFAGFKIRPPINTPDWMMPGHQPSHPWLVAEHRCIIFGITALAENSAHYPGSVDEIIIHNDPPILLGNHARNYDLITLRNTQVPKEVLAQYREQSAESGKPAPAEVLQFPSRVAA